MVEALKSPLFLTWEVTGRCNLKCRVCYNDFKNICRQEISGREVDDLMDQLAECRPLFVSLTGGEPLIRHDIEYIVSGLSERGIETHIATNGTIYNEDLLFRLKEKGLAGIQVSVDGFSDAHDAIRGGGVYKKAVKTLKFLIDNGFYAKVGTIVTKLNLYDLPGLTDFFYNLGVKKLGVFRFIPTGRGGINSELSLSSGDLKFLADMLEELESRYGTRFFKCDHSMAMFLGRKELGGGCELALKCLCVRPNGDVLGCPFVPIVLGSVRKARLMDIWNGPGEIVRVRNEIKIENLMGACVVCPEKVRNSCRGGCRALAYEKTGSLRMPDPRCWRLNDSN